MGDTYRRIAVTRRSEAAIEETGSHDVCEEPKVGA